MNPVGSIVFHGRKHIFTLGSRFLLLNKMLRRRRSFSFLSHVPDGLFHPSLFSSSTPLCPHRRLSSHSSLLFLAQLSSLSLPSLPGPWMFILLLIPIFFFYSCHLLVFVITPPSLCCCSALPKALVCLESSWNIYLGKKKKKMSWSRIGVWNLMDDLEVLTAFRRTARHWHSCLKVKTFDCKTWIFWF